MSSAQNEEQAAPQSTGPAPKDVTSDEVMTLLASALKDRPAPAREWLGGILAGFLLLVASGGGVAAGIAWERRGQPESEPTQPSGQLTEADVNAQVALKVEQERREWRTETEGIEKERDESRNQLALQTAILDKLRSELELKSEALEDALNRLSAYVGTDGGPVDFVASTVETPEGASEDEDPVAALVAQINDKLLENQVREYRLLDVEGLVRGELQGVVWAVCTDRGLATGGLHAERCRFELDVEARSVRFILEEGFEVKDGESVAFVEDRHLILLDGMAPETWAAIADEIRRGGSVLVEAPTEEPEKERTWSRGEVAVLTRNLDELLNPSGHSLLNLTEVVGRKMKGIRLEGPQPGGLSNRVIEADVCEVFKVHPGKYIELRFRRGFVEDKGGRRPFFGDELRLPLPEEDSSRWTDSVPMLIQDRG